MTTSGPDRDPYFIDFPQRIQSIQREMAKEDLDVYLVQGHMLGPGKSVASEKK